MRPETISGQTAQRRAAKEEERSHCQFLRPWAAVPERSEVKSRDSAALRQKGTPNGRGCCRTVRTLWDPQVLQHDRRIGTRLRPAPALRRRQDRKNRSAGAAPWPPPPRSSIGAAPAGDLGTFLAANRTHVESSNTVPRLISTTINACFCIDLRGPYCE